MDDVLCSSVLQELVALDPVGDGALFATFVTSFERDASLRLPELRAAVTAGDVQAVRAAAHALRGAAATLGATRVQALAAQLEAPGEEPAAHTLADLVDTTARELGVALEAIAAFQRRSAGQVEPAR